jgi:transcriptional regulator GlxA family with amidase domain
MDRRVRWILGLLEQQWQRVPSVTELARTVGLGTSRLEHLFKQHAKITIREFVLERRLAAAAQMLSATEERVSTISYSVGFNDVSNFNHVFKRHFGVSPRMYRERSCNAPSSSYQGKAGSTK